VHAREDLENYGDDAASFGNDTTIYSIQFETPSLSQAAMTSPAHTFMMQASGARVVLLFPPERAADLHFYPLTSPRRRQSMLDFANNLAADKKVPCLALVLFPGQTLYIPPYWTVRTSIPKNALALEPSANDFSMSISAISASFEQFVSVTMDRALDVDKFIPLIGAMASAPEGFKDEQLRQKAAAAKLIVELLEQNEMGAQKWLRDFMSKMSSGAEGLGVPSGIQDCVEPVNMHKLESEASRILDDMAKNLAQSKTLLWRSYEDKLPPEFGYWKVRVEAIWRFVIGDIVERLAIRFGKIRNVEMMNCILQELKSASSASSNTASSSKTS
jgi:hypothetical protein